MAEEQTTQAAENQTGKKKAVNKKKTAKKRKTAKKKAAKKKSTKKKTAKRAYLQRPYPRRSIEDALIIAQKIKEMNGGNPWKTDDVASATLGVARNNTNFFYVAASSQDYGLTIGGRDTDKIELADLGRAIVYPPDEKTEREKKIEAFFSIEVFKKVYDYYGGSKSLPEQEYLNNVLQSEFGLVPDLHSEFTKLFKANCKYLGIEDGIGDIHVKPTEERKQPGDIRVVGQPKGKFDRTAFVIMPFGESGVEPRPDGFFDEVLSSIITPAGNSAGFSVETANQSGSDVIQSTIVDQLLKADLVIADLTDHNPNVLFELGIRIAKELPVALIRAEGTGPIFDVDHMLRVFNYTATLWQSSLKKDLPKLADHIKAAWENRTLHPNYMQIVTAGKQVAGLPE